MYGPQVSEAVLLSNSLLMQVFADKIPEDGTLKLNGLFGLGRGYFVQFKVMKQCHRYFYLKNGEYSFGDSMQSRQIHQNFLLYGNA